jgi:predicted RNA-binding Zn ribbon-like protein
MARNPEAPGQLELVRGFLNTHDVEDGVDDLATPAQLGAWLAEHGLLTDGGTPDRGDVRRAVRTREALRALTLANNGELPDPAAVGTLNEVAERTALVIRFEGDGDLTLAPRGSGPDAALGAILSIVFRSMAEGSWPRLKACRAHTCRWAFYDHSKNRSGTWCSMEVCGNRAKARAYRERHGPA